MNRWITVVALACAATLVLAGCGQPAGQASGDAGGNAAGSKTTTGSGESSATAKGVTPSYESTSKAPSPKTETTEENDDAATSGDVELRDPMAAGSATLAKAKMVRPGMTYDDVVEILGKPNATAGVTEMNGTTTAVYGWKSKDSTGYLSVTFTDGKVTKQEQKALK